MSVSAIVVLYECFRKELPADVAMLFWCNLSKFLNVLIFAEGIKYD